MTINEHKNLHFENEKNVHLSSKNNEESDNGLDLDLDSPCTYCLFSYFRRSRLVGNSNYFKSPIYVSINHDSLTKSIRV
jgi:hypothetical protein